MKHLLLLQAFHEVWIGRFEFSEKRVYLNRDTHNIRKFSRKNLALVKNYKYRYIYHEIGNLSYCRIYRRKGKRICFRTKQFAYLCISLNYTTKASRIKSSNQKNSKNRIHPNNMPKIFCTSADNQTKIMETTYTQQFSTCDHTPFVNCRSDVLYLRYLSYDS